MPQIGEAVINDNVDVLSMHIEYVMNRYVFSIGAENEFINYLVQSSNICFDLSPKELKKVYAYELREANKL